MAQVETSFGIWPNLPIYAFALQVQGDTHCQPLLRASVQAHPCHLTRKIFEMGCGSNINAALVSVH